VKERRRMLGIDFGTVRVGYAISDPDRIIASPLETYTRRSAVEDAAHLLALIEREEVGLLVLGLPLHTDGRESQKSGEVRKYAEWLKSVTGMTVTFYDERFTTVEAESALWNAGLTHKKRKDRRDRIAAQMMLQSYIEAGCPESM